MIHAWPVAPPIPNDTSFYLRFLRNISGVRDDAGRPLHEVDFRAELSSDDARTCPYPGSRRGYLMNRSALHIIASDWRRIRGDLRLLIDGVSLRQFEQCAGTLVWARSLLPMFVPLYALRQSPITNDGVTLPNDVSGLFKVMLDVPTTIDLMLVEQWSAAVPPDPGRYSPAEIAAYAERMGILNNGEWTCAGPPGLIMELLTLLQPSSTGDDDGSGLAALISLGEFEAFATVTIRQYALSQAFQASTAHVMERAFSRIGNYPGYLHPPERRLAAYERRRRIVLRRCHDEMTAKRVVSRYCDIATQEAAGTTACESRAAMLDAVARSQRGTSRELLEAQAASDAAYQAAVTSLQNETHDVLGACDRRPVDLSPLSREDFPSTILRRCVEGAEHGPRR